MTWANGSLGLTIDNATDSTGYLNYGGFSRLTSIVGSKQDRVMLSAGASAEWFPASYQQPPDYLDEDTKTFRGGTGAWGTAGDFQASIATVADTTGRVRVGQITMGNSFMGLGGCGVTLDGLELGSTYTAQCDVSCDWAASAPAWSASGTTASGGSVSSVAPTYPVTVTAGDLLLLHVTSKYDYNSDPDPTVWTLISQGIGGAGASGSRSGLVYFKVYATIADGTETGTYTVNSAVGVPANSMQAQFTRITGGSFDVITSTGSVLSASLSYSASIPTPADIASGDKVFVISGVNDGVATVSAISLTIPGCTVSAATQRYGTGQSNGDGTAMYLHDFSVTAGTASGAASTFAFTFSSGSNTAGVSAMIRVRSNPRATLTADSDLIVSQGITSAASTLQTLTTTFVATKTSHTVRVANYSSSTAGQFSRVDNFQMYDGPSTASPILLMVAGDPVQRGYAALVSPQKFWQRDDNPDHIYFSGGMSPGFTFTNNRNTQRRLDDAYVGSYYVSNDFQPDTNSDVISPRAQRQTAMNPAFPYKQGGSAFHSTLYTPPPMEGGVVYRENRPRIPTGIPLPFYISGFIKTTYNFFNFLGSYIDYIVCQAAYNPGVDAVSVMFCNNDDTTAGTTGYLAVKFQHFGSDAGRVKNTAVVVNDGQWHHWLLLIDATGKPTLYVDGIGANTVSNSDVVNNFLTSGWLQFGNNYFNSFNGEMGFHAFGDATYVTEDRIKYLASMRTLPDHVLAQYSSTGFAYADKNSFHYQSGQVDYVATQTAINPNNQTNTSLTVSLGSTKIGDCNVIQIGGSSDGTAIDPVMAIPNGWTKVTERLCGAGDVSCSWAGLYYRFYQQGDPSSVTFSWTNAGQMGASCQAYRGVDPLNPIGSFTMIDKAASNTVFSITLAHQILGGYFGYGFMNRTGTAYTGMTDTVRATLLNASATDLIMLDAGVLPYGSYTRTIAGSNTLNGVQWAFVLRPTPPQWTDLHGRLNVFDGTNWQPDPNLYFARNAQWKRP